MQKILLSTAIFAASASLASADITVSGDARMGLVNDFVASGDDPTIFTSRARLIFTLSGQTDTGLEFGASFRADSAIGAAAGTAGEVHVSGAFGKLSMGDVDGAAASAVGQAGGVGLTGLGDHNEIVFIGTGGVDNIVFDANNAGSQPITADQTALYEYSSGGLSFYASINQSGFVTPVFGETLDSGYSVGAAYRAGGYRFGIGYEELQLSSGATEWKVDQLSLGADASFGGVTVKARYAEGGNRGNNGFIQDHTQWALSATYGMDDLSVTGFTSHKQFTQGAVSANVLELNALGLGATYDLGGGAMVKGGVVQLEEISGAGPAVKDTAFDLGVAFVF